MHNDYFQFKQFCIRHHHCAMKIGTDGVLLGAWTDISDSHHILDIGTGTGLIALMLAQRNATADITAVDIDPDAVSQARDNIRQSPWPHRIQVLQADIRQLREGAFDLIVSNPPFFSQAILPPDRGRQLARHTTTLSREDLIIATNRLLTKTGRFCVILPYSVAETFIHTAWEQGLHLTRRTNVYTKPNRPPKRTLLMLSKQYTESVTDALTLKKEDGTNDASYQRIVEEFYLT